MVHNLQPAKADASLFYLMDKEASERYGAIGYLRSDFGKTGCEFWATWFDIQPDLKACNFKTELDEVINSLRDDGNEPPLASRDNLSAFCVGNPGNDFGERGRGYSVRTQEYTYYFRFNPCPGDYDIYCFAYDNRLHLPALAELSADEVPE